MTRSKLFTAMVAGFLLGQAIGPCDQGAAPLSCGCEDAASGPAPDRLPDGRAGSPHGRRPIRRGGAAHRFIPCDAASADAAAR
jgi:hypothetical protein